MALAQLELDFCLLTPSGVRVLSTGCFLLRKAAPGSVQHCQAATSAHVCHLQGQSSFEGLSDYLCWTLFSAGKMGAEGLWPTGKRTMLLLLIFVHVIYSGG